MSAPIRIDGFEAIFARDADPWGTFERRGERMKREAILRAVGHTRGRVLELACGNGSNTVELADRSLRLLALDGAPSAVSLTRDRVPSDRVSVETALLPEGAPRRPFDLIVIAEVLYYLTPREIARLGQRLRLARGGRIVLVHHHIDFPDTSTRPAEVHDRLLASLPHTLTPIQHLRTHRWRLDALTLD